MQSLLSVPEIRERGAKSCTTSPSLIRSDIFLNTEHSQTNRDQRRPRLGQLAIPLNEHRLSLDNISKNTRLWNELSSYLCHDPSHELCRNCQHDLTNQRNLIRTSAWDQSRAASSTRRSDSTRQPSTITESESESLQYYFLSLKSLIWEELFPSNTQQLHGIKPILLSEEYHT